ncbi:MAG: hypothetical protein GY898_31605 [Proteobacteria bacterium]|nr:hypothetical protein [Pseudomonadota bacterium]
MRFDVLTASVLALFLMLLGCPEPEGDDDDVTPPPTDDDDDDATSGPSSIEFDPSDVDAGAIVDVVAHLENFVLGQNAVVCCASDEVVFFGFDQDNSTQEDLAFSFFFGLRADGEHGWGIDNDGDTVEADFSITGPAAFDEVTLGANAAAGEVTAGGFAAYHVEVTGENQFILAQASGLAPEDFHPWVWILGDDGFTGLAAGGFANPDAPGGYDAPLASFFAEEAGSYFVRVEDNLNGAGTFQLDLAAVPAGAPTALAEVEPNDETADWQDLGALAAGVYSLTGVGDTAGHNADNDLNGDLDVFRFQVAESTVVNFALTFATGEDFDAVIYDDSDGDTELGFGSAQAISLAMASTANPEGVALLLEAGTPYVIGIGNWEGSDDQAWTMDLTVVPSSFPEGPVGDDDDSSGDDDDSAGDDDDDDSADDDDDSSAGDDDDSAR